MYFLRFSVLGTLYDWGFSVVLIDTVSGLEDYILATMISAIREFYEQHLHETRVIWAILKSILSAPTHKMVKHI